MSEKTVQERLAQGALNKGEALLEMGEKEKGMAELAEAYRLAPHVAAVAYAHALLEEGSRREEGGDTMAALEHYRQALRVAPEEGPLRQEIEAMVYALEARIQQQTALRALSVQHCPRCGKEIQPDYIVCPYCAHPLQVTKPTLWQAILPRKFELLWMLALVPGWITALLWINPSMGVMDSTLVVVVISAIKWAIAGGAVGILQYFLLRSRITNAWWWVLISTLAAGGNWVVALIVGGRVGDMLYLPLGMSVQEWWSVYWAVAWAMALMVNAVFNGFFVIAFSSRTTVDRM